ncbi:MAG: transposase [Candidatus Paceibacterota bacterium]
MANRKVPFVNEEIYHVFNRGVDKREIFLDKFDVERFFFSMLIFNSIDPSISVYSKSFELELVQNNQLRSSTPKLNKLINFYNNNSEDHLVEFIAYCLNLNHFHFVIRQKVDGGISEFMKRIGGYTCYFNKRYKRTGSLFGSRFKAVYVKDNTQLLHLSAYVNLNNQLRGSTPKLTTPKLSKSSWGEYVGKEEKKDKNNEKEICRKEIILDQFKTKEKYKDFALNSLEDIVRRKNNEKEYEVLLVE